MTPIRTALHRPVALVLAAGAVALASGCSSSPPPPRPALQLSGPTTNITVAIPDDWHQVINSSAPAIPEMVTPVTCAGNNEASCADGLVRTATTLAATPADAARDIQQAVTQGPGLTAGPVTADGPAPVGPRDGYRKRFTFTNGRGVQNAQVAVVASGPTQPDAQGQREYSVVLAWTAVNPKNPPGPTPQAVDQVIDTIQVQGGDAPKR